MIVAKYLFLFFLLLKCEMCICIWFIVYLFIFVFVKSVLDAPVTKGRLMCSTQCSLSENFLKWDISGETRVFIFTKCNFWNCEKNVHHNNNYDHDGWGRKQGDIKHKDAVDELISSAPASVRHVHHPPWVKCPPSVVYQLVYQLLMLQCCFAQTW